MNLVFLGAPGAGKGTQAGILAKRIGLPAISTGQLLREAVKNETPYGMTAKFYMDLGELVPDEVIIDIINERLTDPDCVKGCVLDGMPRTIVQAEALENNGIEVDVAISIEIQDEEIVERMSGRRTCNKCGTPYHITAAPSMVDGVCDECGGELETRKDDYPETVRNRLIVFHRDTEPLKDYYMAKGILIVVDNKPGIEATTKVIFEALGIFDDDTQVSP